MGFLIKKFHKLKYFSIVEKENMCPSNFLCFFYEGGTEFILKAFEIMALGFIVR
jgi:hypothetical protein